MHGEHISHHSLSHALTDYAHVVHLPVMITHIGGSSDRNSTLIFMVCLCRLSFSSVDIGFQFLNIHCRSNNCLRYNYTTCITHFTCLLEMKFHCNIPSVSYRTLLDSVCDQC